jgi:hypothetical protein
MWRRDTGEEWHQDAQMWRRKRDSRKEWGRLVIPAERERDAVPFLCS